MTTATSHDLTEITLPDAWNPEFIIETTGGYYWTIDGVSGKEKFATFVDAVKFAMLLQSIQTDATVEGEELLVELAAQMESEVLIPWFDRLES